MIPVVISNCSQFLCYGTEHGCPPHFTAVMYSFSLKPHELRLRWLPICAQTDFKIATLIYKILSSGHLAYRHELISQYQPFRSLRSNNMLLLTVSHTNLTAGQCAFSYSSPVTWNSIISLSVSDAPSVNMFKHHQKSFYFHSIVSCLYICLVNQITSLCSKIHLQRLLY